MDSTINILSSNILFSGFSSKGFESSNRLFPSLLLLYIQSSIISFDQGFIVDRISPEE